MPLRLLVLLTGYILVPLMHQLRRRRRRGRIFFKSIFYGAIKIKTPKISSTTLFKNQSGNAAPIPPTSKNFSLSSSSSSLSLSLCLFLSSRECHKHNLNSLSLSYTFAIFWRSLPILLLIQRGTSTLFLSLSLSLSLSFKTTLLLTKFFSVLFVLLIYIQTLPPVFSYSCLEATFSFFDQFNLFFTNVVK